LKLTLHRDLGLSPDCTLGMMTIGDSVLQTIERPWVPSPLCKSGKKGVSRVAFGQYKLVTHSSEAHPKTWALVNPDLDVLHWPDPKFPNARTVCLIHAANFASELRGCIAPGLGRSFSEVWMVTRSRDAIDRLMASVPWTNDHTLEIA